MWCTSGFQCVLDDLQLLNAHAPEDGVYVYGLFCEAGRWDKTKGSLEESEPKVLFSAMPIIWFNPKEQPPPNSLWKEEDLDADGKPISVGYYCCPLYNTSARRGVLATTGHSSNYVCPIIIPTSKAQSHWIKRGTALLMQLDD